MSERISRTETLYQEWKKQLEAATNERQLEELRQHFLGKKGEINQLMRTLGSLPVEEKRILGPAIQTLKKTCESDLATRKQTLIDQKLAHANLKQSCFDVTAEKPGQLTGSLHPYTQIIEKVETIFTSMGFEIFDGPEVETDYANFTALNIPEDHPARDMYDTFWLTKHNLLMRTHTSTVQTRAMKKAVETNTFPLAGISCGRVFRHEQVDASHDFMFLQCEGIVIGKNITIAHLFGVLKEFINTIFNTNRLEIRTRPGFFPFVEPGFEIDVRCPFCTSGCPTCKKTRWIEIFPGGLIHPRVLEMAGINAHDYSGFAFGFGLTRLAMLIYGIHDIRLFHSGKGDFLKQFK